MFGITGQLEGEGLHAALVQQATDRATPKALKASAAYVWRIARNSLKPARQVPIKSLTPEQLLAYRIAQAKYKRGELSEKPKRPLEPSKPGEPPRMISGLLRTFLLFEFDEQKQAYVIGSKRLPRKGLAPKTLEKGGTATIGRQNVIVAPRPYMMPALNKETSQMAKRWENSIK